MIIKCRYKGTTQPRFTLQSGTLKILTLQGDPVELGDAFAV